MFLALVSMTACPTESPTEDVAPAVPAPQEDFYQPPDPLTAAAPGTLIWAEEVRRVREPTASVVWRILYHSRSAAGRDIAVSGYAVVPERSVEGPRPIYAWAHGTAGMGDQCAPSHGAGIGNPPFAGDQLARGRVLVATDYEGLGTPGTPTYTVGRAEGHAVLDAVRAASELPGVGPPGRVLLLGHSQGGHAVLFAAEIANSYAPEIDLAGVVAVAPAVELSALVDYLGDSAHKGLVVMGAMGLGAAYPDLDLSVALAAPTLADLPRVEQECAGETITRYAAARGRDVVRQDPSSVPQLERLLRENSPGAIPPAAPVLIAHGTDDEQIPASLSAIVRDKYCAAGGAVVRREYADASHSGVLAAATTDILPFIERRYEGQRPESDCG